MGSIRNGLLERFEDWAGRQPDKRLFTFVDDGGSQVDALTYQECYSKSRYLAWILTSTDKSKGGLGLQKDDKVLLVYLPSLDFIIAFLACLLAGVVAVPVYPPNPAKLNKDIKMFSSVSVDCGAKFALTSTAYDHLKTIGNIKQKISLFSEKISWPDLEWINTEQLLRNMSQKYNVNMPRSNSGSGIAFLQYTSGSTSDPKGVIITPKNLDHNLSTICKNLSAGEDTVVVSWLPQYHDMGLIGAYLGVIYCGGCGVYMSPLSFIRDPMLWIRMISKYQGTHVQAPNFAYALCARKSQTLKDSRMPIDLSSVRHMINGAEPVDGPTIDSFAETFKQYLLPEKVIFPTFGLAEHTVYVTGGGTERVLVDKELMETEGKIRLLHDGDLRLSKLMIGCGQADSSSDIDLRIVDPDELVEMGEEKVGEIWISSPSKASGYYGKPEMTQETFNAVLNGCPKTFIRTGDLGFLYNKEVFICGRIKDLVIVRGRNHFPQDIEKTIEEIPDIRPGCCAAFSTEPNGKKGEVLVVVAELRDPDSCDKKNIVSQMRKRVAADHGVALSGIALLKPRLIPKTTSGKIARRRCKNAFDTKTLNEILRVEDWNLEVSDMAVENHTFFSQDEAIAPTQVTTEGLTPDQILSRLRIEISQLVEMPSSSVNDETPLQQLGMDSMALTQLRGIIQNQFKFEVEEVVLYAESTTLKDLHAHICGMEVERSSFGDEEALFHGPARPFTNKSKSTCCSCFGS